MMSSNLLALCVATVVLTAIPGPNVALIVANSLRYGLRSGSVTVLGTTAGIALQLSLVVLGLGTLLELAAGALAWIKWAGVAYLLYVGVKAWREPAAEPAATDASRAVFWRAVMIATLNPKTLLFNAAFLPQFLAPGAGIPQFLLIAGVYLAVVLVCDLCWACFASRTRSLFGRFGRLRNRVAGGFLIASGVGLALTRRDL